MKKIFSIFCLVGVLTMSSPVFASPGQPYAKPSPERIHAGAHHRPHMQHHHGGHIRHHGGFTVHTGHPRHSHWRNHRFSYWYDDWCDYRLGYATCHNPHCRYHRPFNSVGFSIRF